MVVCERCGAQIKNIYRIGKFSFGSECVLHIDANYLSERYGNNQGKAVAVFEWIKKQPKKTKNIAVDIDSLPEVGMKMKSLGGSTLVFDVTGFSKNGVVTKYFWKGWQTRFIPYDGISQYELISGGKSE